MLPCAQQLAVRQAHLGLFAVAIQELVTKLKSTQDGRLDLNVFYLDDGVLAVDARAVSAALQFLQANGEQLGLKLNIKKCELVLTGHSSSADLTSLFPRNLLVDSETGEPRILTNGKFELLGAAIGDVSFCSECTNEKVATASKLLDRLATLEDPQVSLRLMQRCAGVCILLGLRGNISRYCTARLSFTDGRLNELVGSFSK